MKKLKINLLAIIGMMVAVATLAFTAPNSSKETNIEDTYWFLIDEEGLPSTAIPSEPSECEVLTEPDCAREYEASSTEVVNNKRQVKQGMEEDFISHTSLP